MKNARLTIVDLEECGSTNDEAWRLAPGPALVLARTQTQGRGRQGRSWQHDRRNLALSLVMPPPKTHLGWLPLASGVAAIDTMLSIDPLARKLGSPIDLERMRLKWPNDLMLSMAKLGGILCESRFIGDRASAVVVGFGMNLVSAPRIAGLETCHLLPTDLDPALAESVRWVFAREWARCLLDRVRELETEGSEPLRKTWTDWAKLDAYSTLTVHDRSGAKVELRPVALDAQGKLEAIVKQTSKTVFLDQADSMP